MRMARRMAAGASAALVAGALGVTALAVAHTFIAMDVDGVSPLEWLGACACWLQTLPGSRLRAQPPLPALQSWLCETSARSRREPAGYGVAYRHHFPDPQRADGRVTAGAQAIHDALARAGAARRSNSSSSATPSILISPVRKKRPSAGCAKRGRTLRSGIAGASANHGRKAGNVADFVRRWGRSLRLHGCIRRRQSDVGRSAGRTGPAHGCASAHGADPDGADDRQFTDAGCPLASSSPCAPTARYSARGLPGGQAAQAISGATTPSSASALLRPMRAFRRCQVRAPRRAHPQPRLRRSSPYCAAPAWRVEIAPEIEGSYEESPPTLGRHRARDRRWARGNLSTSNPDRRARF